MRNMKKFLALVLAMLMVCSMAVMTTSAAEEGDYTDAAQHLAALKIMKGNENGDLMMDAGVTRYQTALFFVQALTGKTDAAVWNAEKKSANFADVIDYGTAIDYAAGLNIVKGRGNGVFGYNDAIIYQDMIVMAIRALGYETADMQYPYGHILAAQKLELLENIDLVNYKAELKRGETAQLIWNMLNTEIAVVDPLTDKVIYPGETGLTDAITETAQERTTLLVEAGFADGEIEGIVEEFIEADEDDEDDYDRVVVAGIEFAAADLGITAETPKISYLGLPVTVFVDCAVEDFEALYADEEATVVFVDYEEYTTVVNLGDEGNIKFVVNNNKPENSYFSFGGTKFTLADTVFVGAEWTENGWAYNPDLFGSFDEEEGVYVNGILENTFTYTTKNGYNNDDQVGNTYGEISYRSYETTVTVGEGEEAEDVDVTVVEALYVPYGFAQYITRELPSSTTGKDETYTIVGLYEEGYENIDKEVTDFAEYFVGTKIGETTGKVTTSKVSKAKGEAAMTVTVEGESVQSGDFFFGAYNAVDNILTVAKNCGTFETGRMTASSNSKETVKINGTNMEFGFAGLYGAYAEYDAAEIKDIIDTLEAGKDNVKYIAVDGNVVYMTTYEGEASAASYGFAVVTADAELMAKLLGITETKYTDKLTDGLYVEDGYVVMAGLNVATGEWELIKVAEVALDYDAEEEEFIDFVDVATMAKYTEITSSINNAGKYRAAKAILAMPLVAVVEEADGVYTVADINVTDGEDLLVDRFVTDDPTTEDEVDGFGLTFNSVGRTNAIKATADADVETARVSTADDTVIVVIGTDAIEVRTGVQTSKRNVDVNDAVFFAADASLIVLVTESEVDGWGKGTSIAADDTYYVVLPEFGVEYGTTENEDEYTLTIEGLFDLKTLEMADPIVITDTYDVVSDLQEEVQVATVFSMLDGEFAATEMDPAEALAAIYADDDFVVADLTEFVDEETIAIDMGLVDITTAAPQAAINATVITLDFTEFDWADIDMDSMFVPVEYDEADVTANKWDVVAIEVEIPDDPATEADETAVKEFYNYILDLDETVVEINEPMSGIVGNFELAVANGEEFIPVVAYDEAAEEYVLYGVEYFTAAAYDDKAETVTMYVVKCLFPVSMD